MTESAIMLLISIAGALGTLVGTVWTVRGMLAKFDVRFAQVEERMLNGHQRFERLEQRVSKHSEKLENQGTRLLDLERPRTNSHPKLRPN